MSVVNLSYTQNISSGDSISYLLKYGSKFEQTAPDSAWYYYEKAHQIAKRNNNKLGLSQYISHAIVLLNNKGDYQKALDMSQETISLGNALKDTVILVKGYNNVANEYEYLGELQEASKNYIEALRLADLLGNPIMQQKLNNNIASVFIELKDYTQANIYASKAYNMSKANRDTAEMGSSLINLGVTESHLKKYDLAMDHLNEAIKIGSLVRDVTLIADARLNKGDIYTKENKLNYAQHEYEQVHLMAERMKMPDYNLYAIFSLALVAKLRNNNNKAATLIKHAIVIGEELSAKDELREMYNTLSTVLERTGDIRGALIYRKKYETLNDSIMNTQVKTNINRLQIQYKAAQKDKQIAQQNLQIEKNKSTIERENILLIFSVVGIVILLLLTVLIYRFYLQRKKLHQQTILNYEKEQEVVRLKAIMEGKEEERRRISREMHDDIGSSLTTIMYLGNNLNDKNEENRSGTIAKIIATAGNVVEKMNEIIWSMSSEYNTLDDLFAYIRYNIVGLLENHNINYTFNIPDEVPKLKLSGEKRRNIYLVIKESIHNVIKHSDATEVTLDFCIYKKDKTYNELRIEIHDTGKGMDISNSNKFGNGLKNMKYRMKTIEGKFTISSNKGTTVKMTLPLQAQFL